MGIEGASQYPPPPPPTPLSFAPPGLVARLTPSLPLLIRSLNTLAPPSSSSSTATTAAASPSSSFFTETWAHTCKSSPSSAHLSAEGFWKGKRVVVDGNAWLHRASYACARQLCTGSSSSSSSSSSNDASSILFHFVSKRIKTLHDLGSNSPNSSPFFRIKINPRATGATVTMVFDGAAVPAKVKP